MKQVLTKEEALKRFAASKDKKRKRIAQLEKELKQVYEEQTGLKANYFSAIRDLWISKVLIALPPIVSKNSEDLGGLVLLGDLELKA